MIYFVRNGQTEFNLERRVLGAAVCLLPLASCSLLFPPSAPQLYRLTPQTASAPHAPLVRGQLVVAMPVAPGSLDTDRIALTRNPTTLDYFANSAWTDRVRRLLQGLMIDTFQNSGRIVAVGSDSNGLNADYRLETELRDFQARYSGSENSRPTVGVRLAVQLVKVPDRRVIGSIVVTKDTLARGNDLKSIVEAFDTVVGEAITQIVNWTLGLQ